MTHEEWRAVSGYEGIYEVSNLGRVRSYRRNRWGISDTPKIIRGDVGLYYGVTLCKDGTQKVQCTHRLVAEAFVPNPRNLNEVNHIDGNKHNNAADNLEWCTHRENIRHAVDNYLMKGRQKRVVCKETSEVFVSITAAAKSVGGRQASLSRSLSYGTGVYKGKSFEILED